MSFFGSSSKNISEIWHKIESENDLITAIENSNIKNVVIFKHSTRCIISKTVLKNFENEAENSNTKIIDFYYLDLLNYRNISNEIVEQFNITHQSPQVILIKNEEAIYNASHDGISLETIKQHLI
jgi:bacillithiol system protein YtxJ